MASVHKQPGRPFWFAAFTNPNGKRAFRSTKTKNKKEALEICRTWQRAARVGRGGGLSVERAHEIVAQGVADVFAVANHDRLPHATIREWCNQWLSAKAIETEESTHLRYSRIIERFLDFLCTSADRDASSLRATDIGKFRDREAVELSRATANLSLKILRMCFAEAVQRGILTRNPAAQIKVLKQRGEAKRRAFTVSEIHRVLAACGEDNEWRGLVLFGLYIGQRLGDLARLTWRAIDLEKETVAFTTRKTGRRSELPLAKPLIEYLGSIEPSDDPNAPIFAKAAKAQRTGTLSNRFRDILVEAGLAQPRPHHITQGHEAKGRNVARKTSELSFHSLRHTAVTFLKAAGVSDALAREIVGHESAAVSRNYTHLDTEDLRRAVERLPDVTRR